MGWGCVFGQGKCLVFQEAVGWKMKEKDFRRLWMSVTLIDSQID